MGVIGSVDDLIELNVRKTAQPFFMFRVRRFFVLPSV